MCSTRSWPRWVNAAVRRGLAWLGSCCTGRPAACSTRSWPRCVNPAVRRGLALGITQEAGLRCVRVNLEDMRRMACCTRELDDKPPRVGAACTASGAACSMAHGTHLKALPCNCLNGRAVAPGNFGGGVMTSCRTCVPAQGAIGTWPTHLRLTTLFPRLATPRRCCSGSTFGRTRARTGTHSS